MSDVIVVGAGVVGAACAYYAARAGLDVTVVDRGPVAGGTTGAGEGNVLVSDKEPGPELDLALLSNRLWRELRPVGRRLRVRGQGRARRRRDRPTSGSGSPTWPPSRASSTRPCPRTPCATLSRTWPTAWPVASSIRRTPRSSPCWPPPASSGTVPVAVAAVSGGAAAAAGRDRHRSPPLRRAGQRRPHRPGRPARRRRRQRRGHLGRPDRRARRGGPAGPAQARLHPGHRAAWRAVDPAQGLHRRLRHQRRQRLGRPGDLGRRSRAPRRAPC